MNEPLDRLLDRLAAMPDLDTAGVDARFRAALDWHPVAALPLVSSFPMPESTGFDPFPHREALADPEKMLFNELVSCGNIGHRVDEYLALPSVRSLALYQAIHTPAR